MLIEKLKPVGEAINSQGLSYSERLQNENGLNERIALTLRDNEDKEFVADINVLYDSELGHFQYIAGKNNVVYPKEFIDEIVKVVASINNVIKYGHFRMSLTELGIHLTYRCDSPGNYICADEFMENINYCLFMTKYYSKELEQFEQKIF